LSRACAGNYIVGKTTTPPVSTSTNATTSPDVTTSSDITPSSQVTIPLTPLEDHLNVIPYLYFILTLDMRIKVPPD